MKRSLLLALAFALLLFSAVGDAPALAEDGPSISGVVWEDLNMDGRRQEGEPGLAGVNLTLTGPRLGEVGSFVQTNANGSYTFEGLVPGIYVISAGAAGFFHVMTYPARILQGEMVIGVNLGTASVDTVDFGLVTVAATTRGGALPVLSGFAWLDGRRSDDLEVAAFIDGVQCGFMPSQFLRIPDVGPGQYRIFFATEALVPGCGRDGATVTFTVNSRAANQVISYPPTERNLTLTAGPPFAVYSGGLKLPVRDGGIVSGEGRMTARVRGRDCGAQLFSFGGYQLSVFSDELQAGCAREGDTVEFFRDGVQALETAAWTPGFHGLDLTFPDVGQPGGRIRPPDTGDGGLR